MHVSASGNFSYHVRRSFETWHHNKRRVNGDTSFLWEPRVTFWLFSPQPRGQTPQRTFTQNGSNDVHSRKDVPFAVKVATFYSSWSPGAVKKVKISQIFGNFSIDLAFNIRGHGENTPYSSSELNESGRVKKQSGGTKLKYILKFYIGGTCHVIRACAMTI